VRIMVKVLSPIFFVSLSASCFQSMSFRRSPMVQLLFDDRGKT
jgi:hypothetical protein